ncbi:MAG: response regulator [Chloroflexota bacterium]|nr:response regulator [Chloroflexota bacterium]
MKASEDIVVIDDDATIADLVRSLLIDAQRSAVTSGALEHVAVERPALVITDLVTLRTYRPADARAYVATVRGRFPGTPVLVLTAHAPAAREADSLGATAVMEKPFDMDDLLALVERLAPAT